MKELFSKINDLIDSALAYVKSKVDELKLEAADKISLVAADIAASVVLAVFGLLFIILFSVAMGLYLNQILSSRFLGFLIVSFFWLLLGIIVYAARKKIIGTPVKNWLISKVYESDKGQ